MSEKICVCGHREDLHAEFIDNMISSPSIKPERRKCLVGNGNLAPTCGCRFFRESNGVELPDIAVVLVENASNKLVMSEPHVVSEGPSTEEEILNGDNKVIKDNYIAGRICEDCINSKYPGIKWPMNGGYIERCGMCALFVNDNAAAHFLSAVTGIPIQWDPVEEGFFTPIPEELIESMARALRIG